MKTIGVIMGGISAERDVSLKTGRNVYKALLNSEKYEPVAIEIEEDGNWISVDDDFNEISNLIFTHNGLITHKGKIDGIYIALHGKFGEDGLLQGKLEMMGIPYTGPGVLSSALGMDKYLFKQILSFNKIPQATFIVIKEEEDIPSTLDFLRKDFRKCVVKPNSGGSSLGVSIVRDPKDLEKAVSEAFQYDKTIIVEEFITGRELSCGVLGNKKLIALSPIEIKPKNDFFDYEAKYKPGFCEEICPAEITEEEDARIRKTALRAFKASGCKGIARIDVFLKENGDVIVIEINTSPGMTSTSLFPKEALATGINFEQLVEKIVDYSFE